MSTYEDAQVDGAGGPAELPYPAVVYQAEGVLRARLDVRVEDAALALRERAAADGVSVIEAARQIIQGLAA